MLVLAVSLLLAECAQCVCVPAADWLAGGVSGCLFDCPCSLISEVKCVYIVLLLLLLLPPFSSSTATVASRCAEFGVFEWSSRSVCRGAGLAELDAAGSKVRVLVCDAGIELSNCAYSANALKHSQFVNLWF